MLKDITLGQYFPGNTPVHRLDPRTKIIITFLFVVFLFMVKSFWGYAMAGLCLFGIITLSGIPFSLVLRSLRPLLVIIIFTAVLNLFYAQGTPVFTLWGITVTKEGIRLSIFMILRIVFLIIGTSMLTYTTSPIMLTDGIERLLNPLKKMGAPIHELSMMMTIALRFIPTLIEETDKIMSAQKARGADFDSGNIIKRARAMIPVLVPLFISAFRRADELAIAMECRCYRGGENRTRLKQLKMTRLDVYALLISLLAIGAVLSFNFITIPLP